MESNEILTQLTNEFKDAILNSNLEVPNRIRVKTTKEKHVEIANYLKHNLGFTTPNMCTGIDKTEVISVIWHIGNVDNGLLFELEVDTDRIESELDSLTPTFKGFAWHERETYDLLGVKFTNHGDMRRLLLPDNWDGFPLREDYVYKKPKYRKPED